jgi:hypothetical protein
MHMTPIDMVEGLWLVELQVPFSAVRTQLDKQYHDARDTKDITRLLSAIADASVWGAHADAARWYAESSELLPQDSSDTLLVDQLSQNRIFASFLKDIADEQINGLAKFIQSARQEEIRERLDLIARVGLTLPPPSAYAVEHSVEEQLKTILTTIKTPQIVKLITAWRTEHIRRMQIAGALSGQRIP